MTKEVQKKSFKRIELLGSKTTMLSDLYCAPLREIGVETIIPSPEIRKIVVDCILRTIAGKNTERDTVALRSISGPGR